MAKQISAPYIECSALQSENSVRDIFHVATLACVNKSNKNVKRQKSSRATKRTSHMPSRPYLESVNPDMRKDKAKSCAVMWRIWRTWMGVEAREKRRHKILVQLLKWSSEGCGTMSLHFISFCVCPFCPTWNKLTKKQTVPQKKSTRCWKDIHANTKEFQFLEIWKEVLNNLHGE